MNVHSWFDFAAATASIAMTVGCFSWRLANAGARIRHTGFGYAVALVGGATVGGYTVGTANLWIAREAVFARSIVGALAGAIAAIEIYKKVRGIAGSTGLIFVPAFATSVVVGRWGCFFSGLADHTHGIPTALPWGHDFGDGIPRHPVQLYESAAMAAFLAYTLAMLGRRDPFFMGNGFYLLVLWYASQRFCWEFLKPYTPVLGPLNLFHLVCAALIAYAVWMLRSNPSSPSRREQELPVRGSG